MNRYLEHSLQRLSDWLPENALDLSAYNRLPGYACTLERDDRGYVYTLFSYPVLTDLFLNIMLVYDSKMNIIADTAGYSCSARTMLTSRECYEYLSEDSDWTYLEYYILAEMYFAEDAWLLRDEEERLVKDHIGQVLFFTNAYVTEVFRRQGIFKRMMRMMRDHVQRDISGRTDYYAVISLDPDIACYGPDARDEPYYYSYEQDEPVRALNREIAEHTGFTPVILEPDDPDRETDGTKLQFAVFAEKDMIIDTDSEKV